MKLKKQSDPAQRCGQDFSQPVIVRPEFGPDADIKTILTRHGAIPAPERAPHYITLDYDTDLTTTLNQRRALTQAWRHLPLEQRGNYKTVEELWKAWKNGELPIAESANIGNSQETANSAPATTPTHGTPS